MTLNIAVAGASGRMGRMLIEAVLNTPESTLCGALDSPQSPALGRDAGETLGLQTGVLITSEANQVLPRANVLIDFTRPEATLGWLPICIAHQVNMVIGTTGFDEAGRAAIASAAQHIAIVFAPNMSVGVNVTFKLLEIAARWLAQGFDIEVIEAHHRNKVDAPSGTALRMGEIIAQAQGQSLDALATWNRHGLTGERAPGTIGFSVVRGGDIVGDHTVLFAGQGERIEITHRSASRATYAAGSLRACHFLKAHQKGLFDMHDVLGLATAAC